MESLGVAQQPVSPSFVSWGQKGPQTLRGLCERTRWSGVVLTDLASHLCKLGSFSCFRVPLKRSIPNGLWSRRSRNFLRSLLAVFQVNFRKCRYGFDVDFQRSVVL